MQAGDRAIQVRWKSEKGMPKRILVIDDEAGVRETFRNALEGIGYQVDLAASGEEGLTQAQRERPDLVFLDLKMPGMDGIETMRELQQRVRNVPVFIVTAYRSEFMNRLQDAARGGLTFNVLDKPLSGDEIRNIARGILEETEIP